MSHFENDWKTIDQFISEMWHEHMSVWEVLMIKGFPLLSIFLVNKHCLSSTFIWWNICLIAVGGWPSVVLELTFLYSKWIFLRNHCADKQCGKTMLVSAKSWQPQDVFTSGLLLWAPQAGWWSCLSLITSEIKYHARNTRITRLYRSGWTTVFDFLSSRFHPFLACFGCIYAKHGKG